MKFGELINKDIITVLCFVAGNENSEAFELAFRFNDQIQVNAIDIYKNQELCDALRVTHSEFMVYKSRQLVFRNDDCGSVFDYLKSNGVQENYYEKPGLYIIT